MAAMKEYLNFWKERGLEFITPRDLPNPEGWDKAPILNTLIGNQSVLEVGCGYGRLATCFDSRKYTGVDINGKAIEAALRNHPNYDFAEVGLTSRLPKREAVLLYTVCLHIPDELLIDQMKRITDAASKTVVIAECMYRKSRENREENAVYDLSNQRQLEEYEILMDTLGFDLEEVREEPYEYYKEKNKFITFAKFTRREDVKTDNGIPGIPG